MGNLRSMRHAGCLLALALLWARPALALAPLQPLIDAAKPGDVVAPAAGIYAGPVTISKPLTLDGRGQVIIDNGGTGSVLTLATDGATVRGLKLVNSGELHNDIDAGIQVRGNYNVIKDNVIDDVLFGINMQQSDNNVVRRNTIHSKAFDLGVRGDAIRLWYSRANRIADNTIAGARDMVVWYSGDNVISGNDISGGRYGLHFMYALANLVENNHFHGNSVGVFLMYSDGVTIRNNRISHALGATGMGIGLKETSDVTIEDNTVIYCATGIYLDVSPFQPDTTNRIHANRLAFNGIGVLFHNDWQGNVFRDNRFENNFQQVSVNAKASARRNDWDGNYWDDYRGFDHDGDAIGDSAHAPRVYADRLWMDVPPARFFRGAPLLSVLDFLERLAPFSEPIVLLSDAKPKMTPDAVIAVADPAPKPASKADERFKYDPFGLKTRVRKYMDGKP